MRGVEAALLICDEVDRGAFASESIRRHWENISNNDRKLTATLVYLTQRRLGLWKHLLAKYSKRPVDKMHKRTHDALVLGIAGLLELKHFKPGVLVNALVQELKDIKDESGAPRESALINAVLHTVMEKAPAYVESLRQSSSLRDLALVNGIPGWAAAQWERDWGIKAAKELLAQTTAQTYLSLRVSPTLDREGWVEEYKEHPAYISELLPNSIRIEANPLPTALPGYGEGQVTPQNESSISVIDCLLEHWGGGHLIDMCMGRGIKAGHLLSYCRAATVEGWDLSAARLNAAKTEFERLAVADRATVATGNALKLEPERAPSAILLDAPCTGSGTWGRHPESKWRLSPAKLQKSSQLQTELLDRAADILPSGGIVVYSTCSLFRDENEKVVGSVVSRRDDLVELPLRTRRSYMKKGKPYGYVIMPESPWMDGFYMAVLKKKG